MKTINFSRKWWLFAIALFFIQPLSSQECDGDITLSSQSDVDAFNCTSFIWNLTIEGADIEDLSPLNTLVRIGESLKIFNNNSLTNLDGLSSLTSAGSVEIWNNDALSNLDGLSSLAFVDGDLRIINNDALTNLDGLSSLHQTSGDLWIINNDLLNNIDGLTSLSEVACLGIVGSPLLTNLDGLSSLDKVHGILTIEDNNALTNLDGLSSLHAVNFGTNIANNANLKSFCGLYGLLSRGGYGQYGYTISGNFLNPDIADIINDGPCIEDFTIFLNSQHELLSGGSLEYKESGGSWQKAEELSDGIFSVVTDLPEVSLRMTYGPQIQRENNISTDSDYAFQTKLVTVELYKADGTSGVDGGVVDYTSNGWHNFGTTGDNGTGLVTMEMLPLKYTFRMRALNSLEKRQQFDVSLDQTVSFQLVQANVLLKKDDGKLGHDDARVYSCYTGSQEWKTIGLTGDDGTGRLEMECLPGIYKFKMEYLGGTQTQDSIILTSAPVDVVFQTKEVTVTLLDDGTGVAGGNARHRQTIWNSFGTSGDDGQGTVINELLPGIYDFDMTYNSFCEQKTGIDVNTTSEVIFNLTDLKVSSADEDKDFQLIAFPNPFNGNTTIAFRLEESARINISVYDQTGRLVETIKDDYQSEGNHKIAWDASRLNKGIYFISLNSNGRVFKKSMVKL